MLTFTSNISTFLNTYIISFNQRRVGSKIKVIIIIYI